MVQVNFNAGQYTPSEGQASVLPEGIYDVQIVKSEAKETRAHNGHYLEMTLAITQGPHMGKKVKARFNLWNNSQEAVEIANSELCALALVVGVPYFQDTQQLHGRPFRIKLACEERNDKPGFYSNNVVGYMDAWGNPPNPSASGQPQGSTMQAPQNPGTTQAPNLPPLQPQGMGGQMTQPNPVGGTPMPPNSGYQSQQPPQGVAGPMTQPPPNPNQWQGNGMQNPGNPQSQGYPTNPDPNQMGQYGTPNATSTGTYGAGNAPAPMGNAGYQMPPPSAPNSLPNGPQGNPPTGNPQGNPMMGNPGAYQQPQNNPMGGPQSAPVAGPGNSPPPANYGNGTTPPWGQ